MATPDRQEKVSIVKKNRTYKERIQVLKEEALEMDDLKSLAGQSQWKEYDGNPVLATGGSGEWDAGALGTMNVIKVGDIYHMYYEAWGIRSEAAWNREEYFSLQIGHAISLDGVHWKKDPKNPILPRGAKGEWDHFGTWDPFVIYEDGLFKMWYGGGEGENCDWGFAVSRDGRRFTKKGQISHLGNVEDIHVVHDTNDQRYHVYYWDRAYEPMGLFHAVSPNETDFDFANAENIIIEGEVYPGMYKFTHVIKENDVWFMFYGNFIRPHCPDGTVRLATSKDGYNWTSRKRNLIAGHDGEVLKVEDGLYLMYFGPQNYFDRKDCDIRVALFQGDLIC